MPGFPNPWLILGWAISLGAAGASGTWAGYRMADLQGQVRLAASEHAAQHRYDLSQAGIALVSGRYEQLKQEAANRHGTVDHEVREIYRTLPAQLALCEPPASALRLLASHVADANAAATGQSRPALPGPVAAAGAAHRP